MVKGYMSKVAMQRRKKRHQDECLQKQGSLSIFSAQAMRESIYHSEIFHENSHQSFSSDIISQCKHIPFFTLKRVILRPLLRTPKIQHFNTDSSSQDLETHHSSYPTSQIDHSETAPCMHQSPSFNTFWNFLVFIVYQVLHQVFTHCDEEDIFLS